MKKRIVSDKITPSGRDALVLGTEKSDEVKNLLPGAMIYQVSPKNAPDSDTKDVVNLKGDFTETLKNFDDSSLSLVTSFLTVGIFTRDGRGDSRSDWEKKGFKRLVTDHSTEILGQVYHKLKPSGNVEIGIYQELAYSMAKSMVDAGFPPENISIRSFKPEEYDQTTTTRMVRDHGRTLYWVCANKTRRADGSPSEKELLEKIKNPTILIMGDQHADNRAKENPGIEFIQLSYDPGKKHVEANNITYLRKEFITGLKMLDDESITIAQSTLAVGLYNRDGSGDSTLDWKRPDFKVAVTKYTTEVLAAAYPKIKPGGLLKIALEKDHMGLSTKAMLDSGIPVENIYFRYMADEEYVSPGAISAHNQGSKLIWVIAAKK